MKKQAWSSNNDSSDGYMPLALIDQFDEKYQASSGFGGLLNQESIVEEKNVKIVTSLDINNHDLFFQISLKNPILYFSSLEISKI